MISETSLIPRPAPSSFPAFSLAPSLIVCLSFALSFPGSSGCFPHSCRRSLLCSCHLTRRFFPPPLTFLFSPSSYLLSSLLSSLFISLQLHFSDINIPPFCPSTFLSLILLIFCILPDFLHYAVWTFPTLNRDDRHHGGGLSHENHVSEFSYCRFCHI